MDLSSFKKKLARLAATPASAAVERAEIVEPSHPSQVCAPIAPEDEARLARIAQLRALIGQVAGKSRAELKVRGGLERRAEKPVELPGVLEQTALGPLHRRTLYLEPTHAHGEIAVARSLAVNAATIAGLALDAELAGVDPRRFLYLDTETTGLAGGTGTLPFLVGLAWFEDESLVIEQLLLRKPGEEKPLLKKLAERMAEASAIVTYNGKSFDWPLLRTRAVLNRVPLPPPVAHLDLLHCARRVLGPRLGEVRLVNVEAEVLGMHRQGDIDGAEIPERFWSFVRGADASQLVPVLEHNANDLVALAAILVCLAERWDGVLPSHAPEDRLAVAKTALRHGDEQRAFDWACSASDAGGSDALTCEALRLAATVQRRSSDVVRAVEFLNRALTVAPSSQRAKLHLELSKLLEHRVRDLSGALTSAILSRGAEPEEAHDKRIARIEGKRKKPAAA